MKTIKKEDLTDFKDCNIGGNYSKIYKCSYHDIVYAYKQFIYISMFLELLPKIKKIGNLRINGSILPRHFVSDNDIKIITYLTDWSDDYTLREYYKNENNTNKIVDILNNLKQNILNLHNKGIIHGDIHDENVLVNHNTGLVNIIDFDNCSYKYFKMRPKYCTNLAREYICLYGINKELDIFLFNFLTFKLINNLVDYHEVKIHIVKGENECFKENDDYKNICDTLLLEAKKPTDKFLIDNYQKVLK